MRSYSNLWVLILLLIVGALLGSIAGELLGSTFPQLMKTLTIGIKPPLNLDLYVINLTFGVTLNINLLSILGFFLAYIIFRKI